MRVLVALLLAAVLIPAQEKQDRYEGPRPPQPDLPYLLHASKLIPTEVADAQEEKKKNEVTYVIPGESSPAKTPLAEPIFLMEGDKLNPERIELYQLEVKSGHREITVSERGRHGARPLKISVARLDGRLYRIEAAEMLENGQYCLSPSDSNRAFCFEIY
jgi:hypothetical protein